MSSRRVKSLIQQAIRDLKRDNADGFQLGGIDQSYSRGKSFEYMVSVSVADETYTKFYVTIVEFGGKKNRLRNRHMEEHIKNGDKILKMKPTEELDEDGNPKFYTMEDCCDKYPGVGVPRVVRRR